MHIMLYTAHSTQVTRRYRNGSRRGTVLTRRSSLFPQHSRQPFGCRDPDEEGEDPWAHHEERVGPGVFEIDASAPETRPDGVTTPLPQYTAFRDQIVWLWGREGSDVGDHRFDSVGGDEQQPVCGLPFTVRPVRVSTYGAGRTVQRLGGAEDRGDMKMLDRSLPVFAAGLLRGGRSQCAPVVIPGCSRGKAGRSAGSRSAPHPGMRARSSSAVSAVPGLSDVYGMMLLRGRRSASQDGGVKAPAPSSPRSSGSIDPSSSDPSAVLARAG